ncbi:hypothetical protein [Sphingomonas sp. LHG3443-2]|uniref:hypothetical protein n=1 Tax=Sphingomonas sp. LHG3443-2 TaxID=2804639 RepID=UPI003CF4A471
MELTFPLASGDRAEAAVTTGASRMRLTSATLVMVAGETCPDPQLVERFVDRLQTWFVDVEVTIVASGVGPAVTRELKSLVERVPDSLVVFLSEPVHADVARLVGIDHAVSDYVVFATPTDEEEHALPQVIAEVEGGADLVTAVPSETGKQAALERLLVRSFGFLARHASGMDFEQRPSAFRVLSRAAALYIVSRREGEVLVRARSLGAAFPATEVTIAGAPALRDRKRSLRRDLGRAVRLMATGSAGLLRASSYLAVLGGGASAIYAIYVLAIYFLLPSVEPGWTTLSLQLSGMLFLFSVQFLLLAENVIHLSTNSGVSHRRHLIIRELRSMKSRRGMALNVVDANGHFHLGAPPLADSERRPSPWNEQR